MHTHHILPRHAGGTDNPSNLFPLSVIQHALAHRNRWVMSWSIKDRIAWLTLSGKFGREEARLTLARLPHTEEHKRKIGLAHKGIKKPSTSEFNRRPETIEKRRLQMLGKQHKLGFKDSEETRRKKKEAAIVFWQRRKASCII